MSKQISNEEEFKNNMNKLSDFYERAKDLTVNIMPVRPTQNQLAAFHELRGILQEMVSLAALQFTKSFMGRNT